MEKRELICIGCPLGCMLTVEMEDGAVTNVHVGVRPQHIKYSFEPVEGYIKCTVYSYESIGNKSVIVAEKDGMILRMIAPNGLSVKIDQDVYVDMLINQTMFFDAETKDYLTRYNEAAVKALVAELEG